MTFWPPPLIDIGGSEARAYQERPELWAATVWQIWGIARRPTAALQNSMAKRLIIVVKAAAAAAAANNRAKEIDAAGGERTFTVGLSASGNLPATHYWCSWRLSDSDHDGLRTKLQAAVDANNARVFNAAATSPDEVLATLGLKRLEPTI